MQICESESQENISANDTRKVHFDDETNVEILDELRNYCEHDEMSPKGYANETCFHTIKESSQQLLDKSDNFFCKHCSQRCCNAFDEDEHMKHFCEHCNRCNVADYSDRAATSPCFAHNCLSSNVANAVFTEVPLETINSDNLCSFVPFILVTGILTLTLVLLVSVSVIYIQNLPLQEKTVTQENQCSCAFGAQCIIDESTSEQRCRCDLFTCHNHLLKPVCGTDNVTYTNECKLNLASCQHQKLITVHHTGVCDPCDGVECPTAQICQLDDNRNPICRCNAVCGHDFKPVCGSDGKTYTNECILRVEACKSRRSLRIIHNGECGARGANPCETLKCNTHQECDIDLYGVATCVCPVDCPPVLKPVCGSDGHNYDSECDLRRQACLLQKDVTLAYKGLCGEEGPCHGFKCEFGAICVLKGSEVSCECGSCTEEFKPVCGSDGISYPNECKMKKDACEQRKVVYLAYSSFCNGCENKNCEHYSLCESDGKGNGRCICPEKCVPINAPVCGSDGVTYPNECEMRVAACNKKEYVTVASRGSCDECLNVHCKYGARCESGKCLCPTECPTHSFEPICSSDGITYINECQMRKASCQRGSDITVSFYGECQEAKNPVSATDIGSGGGYVKICDHNTCRYGGVCDYDALGIPHCVCSYHCPTGGHENEPVCGSDGRLYENECKLQEEACRRQQEIKPEDHRLCQESKILPCDGEPPLIDVSSGREYFCGDGVDSKQCPASSYCHKTTHFAKCCREIALVRSCLESTFGCCPDEETPAQGPNNAGCPSVCNCNRLGSYSLSCDPLSKQCHCKHGVGGLQCDRCEPGFWGLHKISEGNSGCIPCACNYNGSVREDCEQMTGRCVCKHGLQGMKCDVCPENAILTPDGCTDVSLTRSVPGTCGEVKCRQGAICVEKSNNEVQCVCDMKCPLSETNGQVIRRTSSLAICASDGNTYVSECQLRLYACRIQKKIYKLHDGNCKATATGGRGAGSTRVETVTVGPVRRSTVFKTTLQDTDKSTRELTLSVSEQVSTKPTAATPTLPERPIDIPFFNGDSCIEMQRLQAYTRLSIELEFVSYSENAILIYNGQTSSGEGDFVSLTIKAGFLEFRYNLGSGTVILRSSKKITLGTLVKVVAKRYLRDGMLTIEGHEDVAGKSDGDLKSLDLAENLFFGSVLNSHKRVFENVGVKQGFIGCLYKLRIGRKDVDIRYPGSKDILKIHNLHDCQDVPCSSNPCKNDGICIPERAPNLGSFSCSCNSGFTGKHCEIEVNPCGHENPCMKGATCTKLPQGGFSCLCPPGKTGKLCADLQREMHHVFVPDFWGTSYLQLPTLQNVAQAFVIEIWFLTRVVNGLLLYNGQQSPSVRGDFLSLNLVDGHVQFRYNLGSGIPNVSGVVVLTSKNKVSLGEWHTLRITRQRKKGTLQLDDGPVEHAEAKGNLSELNLDQPLFVGGVDNIYAVNKDSGITVGLNGALQRIVVNGEIWDNLVQRATAIKNVPEYSGPPCGYENPCVNEATCVPQLNDYICKCKPRFTGKKCNKPIEKTSFDEVSFTS